MIELIDDLLTYNDWANGKVISLCDGLDDEPLDRPREMGFGSLRATLFHILAADEMWMERWQEKPWREFPKDPEGISTAALADKLCAVAQDRCELIERTRDRMWELKIKYQDSGQNPFHHRLADLILHVVCHGVHHRAQALAYLKSFDRQVPLGIDYIFYRTGIGKTPQSDEAVCMLREYGIHPGSISGDSVRWDDRAIKRWLQYHDWATDQVLSLAETLDNKALQRDFGIGPVGSIVGTLQHLYDVESWWYQALIDGQKQFGTKSGLESIDQFRHGWSDLAQRRDRYIDNLTPTFAQETTAINFGGPDLHYSIVEAVVQNLVHGVHHRAQLINMLRHSDVPIKNIDMLYAIDQLTEPN